jgi:hypothetical protein
MKILILLFALMASSCSMKKFKADHDLMRAYSYELQKKEPYHAPYAVQFQNKGHSLLYIAADHTFKEKSETFKMIRQSFKYFTPDRVIVEGVPRDINLNELRPYLSECWVKKTRKCGEPLYTTYLAQKKNIPVVGGEPVDEDIVLALEGDISREELAYFYTLRQMNQMKRQEEVNILNFDEKIGRQLARNIRKLKIEKNIKVQNFKNYFAQKMGRPYNLKNIQNEELAPLKKGSWFQVISYKVGVIREREIIETIEDQINLGQKVLIVYGSGHLVKSRKILEGMFGRSVKEFQAFVESPFL